MVGKSEKHCRLSAYSLSDDETDETCEPDRDELVDKSMSVRQNSTSTHDSNVDTMSKTWTAHKENNWERRKMVEESLPCLSY